MAPASSASSASEGADDSVYQAKLASSLAGLPVRQGQHQQAQQAQNGTETAHGNGTKDAAPLSDTLDLAVSYFGSAHCLDFCIGFRRLDVQRAPTRGRASRGLYPSLNSVI